MTSKHYKQAVEKIADLAYKPNPRHTEHKLNYRADKVFEQPALGDFDDQDASALSKAMTHLTTYLHTIDVFPSRPLLRVMVRSAIRAGAFELKLRIIEEGAEYDRACEVVRAAIAVP